MEIPFVDLKAQYYLLKNDIDLAIENVIKDTAFIGGKYVEEFESNFSKVYNVKHCISVANGTDSLFIVMKMLGIGQGDEVITVANSWISTSETISLTGARPVFVDIDSDFYTIDETLLEKAISAKTKAIIPVHLYGQACNMELISTFASKYNLYVIEDCAQAHFSEFKGNRVGTWGVAGSFSFYPGKNLGAYGDAGCIITNDDELAIKCRMFARHGALKKHQHMIEGINSRMDGLQAAILSAKLPFILKWTEERIKNSTLYYNFLSSIPEIVLPKVRIDSKHTFHLFVIRAQKRDELMEFLKRAGIETAIHYPIALPNMEAYKYLDYKKNDFSNATKYQQEIISLPMYPELTLVQIEYICNTIKSFYN